jgi:enoyl-CoA hydratase/carnithine racemase
MHMKDLKDYAEGVTFIRSIDELCSSIQDFSVPVIAVIDGPCFGAGMEVAASCDIRIAVEDEKTIFAMPETKIGIPSVVQASLLPALIGWGRTRQLLYFGAQLRASEALEWGFLNELTTRENLTQVLIKWEAWVDEAEPNAVAAQKALMRVSLTPVAIH